MLISFLFAKYKMSGIATKKSGADTAVQLTYPAVFQDVYARDGMPLMYEPERQVIGEMPLTGEDLQSYVHLQRKRDADAMAMAKVHSTRMMNLRSLTGHAGYHLPPVVLGQRRFANPSNGAYFPYSSRQDYHDAPFNYMGEGYEGRGLEGGVLRTAQGQAYGKAKLLDRIRQINAISAAKSAFLGVPIAGVPSVGGPTPAPTAVAPAVPTPLVESSITELGSVIQEIQSILYTTRDLFEAFEGGDNEEELKLPGIEKLYQLTMRLLSIVIRLASEPSSSENKAYLDRVYKNVAGVGGIREMVSAFADPDRGLQEANPRAFKILGDVDIIYTKLSDYIRFMTNPRVYNMSPKDKLLASKSYLRKLDFSGLLKKNEFDIGRPMRSTQPGVIPQKDILSEMARGRGKGGAMSQSVAQAYAEDWDGVGHLDDEEEWRIPIGANTDRFTKVGIRREDTEHGSMLPRTHFDPSMREAFGYASGDWFPTGGRPMGFFGEAPETYGEAPALAEARDSGYSLALQGEQTRAKIADAQARALGDEGANTAIRSVKSPETGEYDVVSGVRTGKGKSKVVEFKMSRKELPTTLDGFKQLALEVEKKGGAKIRINKNSTLKNVRRNFIKRLGL